MKTLISTTKLLAFCLASIINFNAIGVEESANYQTKQLSMFIWSNQIAPIISHKSPNNVRAPLSAYEGVIVDVLESLPDLIRPEIEVFITSRKRGERDLYASLVDMSILSSRWLSNPEKLIYSLPIYTHREFFYATSPIADHDIKELIINKKICIRRGFKFPNIDPFFEEGVATRVENVEESVLFELLMRGRCDFLLMNEFVANAIINSNQWQDEIFKAPNSIDEVGLTIAFHPKHEAFVSLLNDHIRTLEKSGKLDDIVKSFSK